MPAKVLDFGLIQNMIKPFSSIAGMWSLKSRANIAEAVGEVPERLQCGASHRVYLNMSYFAVLAPWECNDTPLQIHILPAKAVLFPATHTRVERQVKFGLMARVRLANFGPKIDFFLIVYFDVTPVAN